jgi:hypothetical protein
MTACIKIVERIICLLKFPYFYSCNSLKISALIDANRGQLGYRFSFFRNELKDFFLQIFNASNGINGFCFGFISILL